ncbi:MAG: hypothetical protein RIR65_365, partial [Planctomycetota bacterium]
MPLPDEAPTLVQMASIGQAVARIEVVLPGDSPFLLRATIPVPRGTLRRDAALAPLVLRGADGVLEPTQLDVVTHHPR